MTSAAVGRGAAQTATRRASRRSARVVWAALWAVLIWLLFVAVTVLTVALWIADPDYAETTPVADLSFFALGAMIGAGFTSQVRRHPPRAGVVQALLAAGALAVAGLLGSRAEPLAGGVLLIAAAGVSVLLHPQPRRLPHRQGSPSRGGAGMALLAVVAGVGYAVVMLSAARAAGPSCFLGQCAHGDRLAEMAATALAIPALAVLAAWRIDGWRLPLWSAGLGAATLGATSVLLPLAAGSLGVLGGTTALAWAVLLIALGEHDRHRARKTETRRRETS